MSTLKMTPGPARRRSAACCRVGGEGDPPFTTIALGAALAVRPSRSRGGCRGCSDPRPASAHRAAPITRRAAVFDPQPPLFGRSSADGAVDQVVDADEVGDEAVGGPLVERLRRPDLEHPALVEDRDAVRERQRLLLVVGHVDGGDAEFLLQLADLVRAPARGSWRRGWTAARRAAGCPGSAPARGRARRAAAGRPRAGRDSARRGR